MDEIIFAYSRADAIADGVLIDISELAAEYGLLVPVAITQAAWSECIEVSADDASQDVTGRTWDVLTCLRIAAKQAATGPIVYFDVLVSKGGRPPQAIRLKSHCGPGDDGRPVLTIMRPNED